MGYESQTKKRRLENQLLNEEYEEKVVNEAKEREIYDPVTKRFNRTKKRATDNIVILSDILENRRRRM